MFMNSIISNDLSLDNFFKQLKYDLYLTKPQYLHLKSILNSMVTIMPPIVKTIFQLF
ncbi:hypothetical protein DFR55_1291 [Herbinix hemicellulosilytica]|nr:hypothetical protein DFR55_1291 [Herbinix hemicellulosilytica]